MTNHVVSQLPQENLVFWISGDSINVNEDEEIHFIINLANSNSSSQPINRAVKTKLIELNNHFAIDFTNTESFYDFTLSVNSPFTIITFYLTDSNTEQFLFDTPNRMIGWLKTLTSGHYGSNLTYTILPSSNFKISTFTSTSEISTVHINGNYIDEGINDRPINNKFRIGAAWTNNRFFKGYISELLIYNKGLLDAERIEIETYLMNKYSPPVSLPDTVTIMPSCDYNFALKDRFKEYSWKRVNSNNELENIGDNHQIIFNQAGKYVIDVIDIFDRSSSDTIIVNSINTNNLISTSICDAHKLEIDLNLHDPDFLIEWNIPSLNGSQVEITEPGDYSVQITSPEGCTYTSPTFTISDLETITKIEAPEIFCIGNSLEIEAGNIQGVDILWSTGATSPFIHPWQSGTYWVQATNANGCTATDTVEVNIAGEAPYVTFDTGTACAQNPVTFTDTTTPVDAEITHREWTFPASQATTPTAHAQFDSPGKYPFELIITLSNGCTGTGRDTVTVHPLPIVNFNYDEVIPCAGNPVAFQSQSAVPNNQTIASYHWKFSNQTTATGIVGSTTFDDLGPQSVTHIVTTTPGCIDSLTAPIIVLGSPEVNFTFDTVCTGLPTTFQEQVNTTQSGGVFYHWDFGDGYYSNFPNTAHSFATPGTYNVTLTATGNDFGNPGCTHSLTRQVSVFAPPTPAITTTPACLGSPITLTDVTTPSTQGTITDYLTTRKWSLPYGYGQGPITIGHDSIQQYIPQEVNNYAVQFDFKTAAGCTGTASANVEVAPIPTAAFQINIPVATPPLTATVINQSTNAQTYHWYLNNTHISSQPEPPIALPDTGTYTLTLIATHSNQCSDTTTRRFTVIDPLYDLAIHDIRHTLSGNKLTLRALLANNGNTPITRFDMKLTLGLHIAIDQHFDFEIQPGEVVEFTLPQMFDFSPTHHQPYVCMEVGLQSMGAQDSDPGNNHLCKSLDREKPHFLPPYPNPADDVLHLGLILPFSGTVSIALHDATGRHIDTLTQYFDAGYHLIPYPTAHLAQGSYILQYDFHGITATRRIVVGR